MNEWIYNKPGQAAQRLLLRLQARELALSAPCVMLLLVPGQCHHLTHPLLMPPQMETMRQVWRRLERERVRQLQIKNRISERRMAQTPKPKMPLSRTGFLMASI